MLYVTFIGELEKIAKAQVGSTLDLKVNPYDLGIHSKREGSDAKSSYRPMAYSMGVPTAAAGGLVAGGASGGFTEGRMLNVVTEKGRKEIGRGFLKDVDTLKKGVPIQLVEKATENPTATARKIVSKKISGIPLSKGESQLYKNVTDIGKRRLSKIPKGMMFGALGAGTLRSLYNIGSFETARATTPEIRRRRNR